MIEVNEKIAVDHGLKADEYLMVLSCLRSKLALAGSYNSINPIAFSTLVKAL